MKLTKIMHHEVDRGLFPRACKSGRFARSRHGWLHGVRGNKLGPPWTRIGAAFPHKEGIGFNIELKAFPIDGRLVVLPPDTDDDNRK
jgi:hypothetical protein